MNASPAPNRARPRVALVHDWLTGMRGGEKVLEQIAELFPDAPIHTLFHFADSLSPTLASHPIRTSWLQRLPGLEERYRSYLPLYAGAMERFDLSGFDLVISTSHCVAKGVRTPDGVPHLCYCHTPVRYAWDQRRAYFPKDPPGVRQLRDLLLDRLQRWDRRTGNRPDAVAANSEFVRQRVQRFWQRDAEVVHPPVDVARFASLSEQSRSQSRSAEDGYLLSIAALSPYKRHDIAIRAAARAGWKLRIVGEGPARAELQQLIADLAAAEPGAEIELLGRVSDDELIALIGGASAFVQPGIEDFGIAAVEALAAAVPVVALGIGGVVDIVEHGRHGLLYGGRGAADPEETTGSRGGETQVAQLTEALERLRTTSFAPQDLTGRAQLFAVEVFRRRFIDFVERHVDPALLQALALSG